MTVSTIALTFAPFRDGRGGLAFAGVRGTIELSADAVDKTTGQTISPRTIDFTLDKKSSATVTLPHSDHPDLATPLTYSVKWTATFGIPVPDRKTITLPRSLGATARYVDQEDLASKVVDDDVDHAELTAALATKLNVSTWTSTTSGSGRLSDTALRAAFMSAVDESGQPIPGKAGRVVFNSDGDPVTIEMVAVA